MVCFLQHFLPNQLSSYSVFMIYTRPAYSIIPLYFLPPESRDINHQPTHNMLVHVIWLD